MTLTDYTASLAMRASPSTVEAYTRDIKRFLADCPVTSVKKIKPYHIEQFLGMIHKDGKSQSTLFRCFMSLRSYFKWLIRNDKITVNPMDKLDAPRFKSKAPTVPQLNEVKAMLNAIEGIDEESLRDRAILELLYSSGLRVSELCSLTRDDITSTQVVIRSAKRGKWRTVPITPEAWGYIQAYLEIRADSRFSLFTSNWGRDINRMTVYRIISKRSADVGCSFSPHDIRHAFATHMLDSGADLRLIQELLGHESVATTQRYTHLSSAQMAQGFAKHHPRYKEG